MEKGQKHGKEREIMECVKGRRLKMNYRLLLGFGLLLAHLMTNGAVFAADEDTTITTQIHGYGSFEAGEVMKGMSPGYAGASSEVNHGWVQKAEFGLYADVKINDRLHILAGPEGALSRSFKVYTGTINDAYIEDLKPKFTFSLGKAEALYASGDPRRVSVQLEAGYFPFKYDSESRNFGEYLFRTGCYPPSIMNKFDRPFAYLLGLRVGNTLLTQFHHDLILNSEMTEFMPALGDFSLSYLADFKVPGLFTENSWLTLGCGISFYRIFSVDESKTTPTIQNTFLKVVNPKWKYDPAFPTSPYTIAGGDSVYQSFAGTKLMGRVAVDVASMIPRNDALKKGDIVFYTEMAILGVTNFNAYDYSNITDTAHIPVDTTRTYFSKLQERMPMMFGLTIRVPYNILDALNCELEYFDSRYINNYENAFRFGPMPGNKTDHEKLKWSFYAKKNLGAHVSIIGQIANDHFVPTSNVNLQGGQGVQDFQEVTLRHGDWWWVLKAKFDF